MRRTAPTRNARDIARHLGHPACYMLCGGALCCVLFLFPIITTAGLEKSDTVTVRELLLVHGKCRQTGRQPAPPQDSAQVAGLLRAPGKTGHAFAATSPQRSGACVGLSQFPRVHWIGPFT